MKIKLQNFHIESIENKGCLSQKLKQHYKNLFSVFGNWIKSIIFAPLLEKAMSLERWQSGRSRRS